MIKRLQPRGWLALVLCLFTAVNSHATGFTLTVTAQGAGTVIRNPSNSSYPPGVTVSITATPNAGWYFDSWSGDTNGSVNPLNVVMNSSLNITGNFLVYPTYPLTLATNGQGSIVLSPSGSTFYSNTVVTATATPAAGWVFTGWTGSAAGPTNPLAFTMNSANSLTGNFAQLPTFDVPPVGITNSPGSIVSFFAHAVGTAPLAYQWYFNNSLLVGATNTTLAYTNVSLAQAGSYRITATNNYGSVTSSVTLLVLTNGSTNPVLVCDEPSLRSAIAKGGWISFGCNGTITLSNTITISNNVILDASGVNATISGGNAVRLFTVAPGASLSATNLTLANGACLVTNGIPGTPADAGAIYNNGGMVTLTSCTLTNNTAQSLISGGLARGGAIFNNGGNILLYQSTLLTNSAVGGGPYNFPSGTDVGTALGGAIYNTNGTVMISGCNVTNNSCRSVMESGYFSPAGTGLTMGGAAFVASGFLVATNGVFSSNLALGGVGVGTAAQPGSPAYGGALAATSGNVTVDHEQFIDNMATGGNAGRHGTAGPASGGAIYSLATLTVKDTTFSENQALAGNNTYAVSGYAPQGVTGSGGAIYNAGPAVLNRCLVASNYAWGGSGLGESTAAFGGNGYGGGIFNASLLAATNCTFALNTAIAGQGGYAITRYYATTNGNAIGGAFLNASNAITFFMNSTLASNLCVAGSDGGFGFDPSITNGLTSGRQIANTNGTLHIHNSLIAYSGTGGNAYGTVTDDGYNISSDGSASFGSGSSYNFTDPKLGPLADNGGPTLTMAPLAISPAIDFGDSNGAPHSDQRGFLRPYGDGYDIGAVEYGSIYTAPSPVNLGFIPSGPNLLLSFSATPTITYHLQSSTNLTSWTEVETIGAFSNPSNISRTITPQTGPQKFYRVWFQ